MTADQELRGGSAHDAFLGDKRVPMMIQILKATSESRTWDLISNVGPIFFLNRPLAIASNQRLVELASCLLISELYSMISRLSTCVFKPVEVPSRFGAIIQCGWPRAQRVSLDHAPPAYFMFNI